MRHTWRVTAQLGGDFVVDADNAKSRWALAAGAAGMTAACVALVIWGGLLGLVGGLPVSEVAAIMEAKRSGLPDAG
jgi:hypothetical protein